MTNRWGSTSRRVWLGGLLAVGVPALLYLLTLDNNVAMSELVGGDLITHQYAQAQFRLTNAPGYPIYTMLGGLWFRVSLLLFWLNPIQRLSLYSTLYAIPALVVVYALLLKVTRDNAVVSALCTLFLGVTHFFWYYATTTEEYTLAVLQMGLLLLWALHWDDLPAPQPGGTWRDLFRTRDRYLVYMAFMGGLCLANLVTLLFAAPALLWFVWSREPGLWRRGKLVLVGLVAAILPLFSYIYVYAVGALHPEWRGVGDWPNAGAWFLDFISTGQGRSELTWDLGGGFPTWVFDALIDDFTAPVLLAVVVGLFLLGRRRGLLMAGILAVYAVFTYIDRYGNWFQVFIPGHVVLMACLAAVADRVWRYVPQFAGPEVRSRWLRWLVQTGLLLFFAAVLLTRLAVNWPRCDSARRAGDDGLRPGWAILADDPAPGAVVVCAYEEGLSLDYLTTIWDTRADVRVLSATTDGSTWTTHPAPIYLTRSAAALTDPTALTPFHLWSQGRLVEIRRRPTTDLPPGVTTLPPGAGIGAGQLSLLGYELHPRPDADALQVVFYWRAGRSFDHDWTVSARLMVAGQIVTDDEPAQDDHPPVWGTYPTTHWQAGEVVRDDYFVPWHDGLEYDRVGVVWYRLTVEGLQDLGAVEFAPVR